MFDTISGLPLHPLVVHAVVVLLPLTVIGTVALVLKPSWRNHYGTLLIGLAAVSTALIPVATQSGEALERRVGNPGQHAALGDQLIWFAVPLLILNVVWVWLGRRDAQRPGQGSRALTWIVAGLCLVSAVAAGVQVYRVGDTGARSAWGSVGSTSAR